MQKIRVNSFSLIPIMLLCFCINAASAEDGKINTTERIIQNNLEDFVLYIARENSYEVKQFGEIVSAYSDIPGPDYNLVLNLPLQKPVLADLEQALSYSHQKKYPFMLALNRKQNSPATDVVIAQYNYKKVGVATLMAISHAKVNLDGIDRSSVKEVSNQQMLDDYCAITDKAFERPAGSTKLFMPPLDKLLNPDFQVKAYLYYDTVNGELMPVGAAAVYLPKDKKLLAGHYGWAVTADSRKKGIMTSLLKNMILIAKEHGYSSSVAQCYDASLRLAERVGFKRYGELELYVNGSG